MLHGTFRTIGIQHQVTAGVSSLTSESKFGSAFLGTIGTNLYAPVDSPEPADAAVTVATDQRYTASRILVSDIVTFSDPWSVLVGARHAKLDLDNTDPTANDSSLSKTTPTAALMFKPVPGALLYLNYAQGVQQGVEAPTGTTNAGQRLPPIVTQQVEFGAKLDRGNVTYTAALFDLNKPFEITDPATLTYVQDGERRPRGLELTATGPLTRDFTVVAGTMILDPTTTNTGDPTMEGKYPVGVPKFTANLWGDYRITPVQGLFVNAGVFHTGEQFLDTANTQPVPAWTRFDVGARYETRIADTRTTFLFGIENVADKNYWAGANSGILTIAEPRMFKLSAKVDF